MIRCCNSFFKGFFRYVLNSNSFYRRIEYGICPICGIEVFRDYKQYPDGFEIWKDFRGEKAKTKYNRWKAILNNTKYGSYSNQNYYFGDYKKVNRKNLSPVYIQLKKNFNNQSEIIGEVKTKIYYGKN